MEAICIVLTLVAGACAPTQAGINARLRSWAGDPSLAALISFMVGTLALAAYVVALRIPLPPLRGAAGLPWWLWTGGFLGAFLVAVTVETAPRLGASTMIAVLVAGQMVAGLVLDHYGLIGFEVRPTTVWRVVGAVFIVTGVVIIRRF